MGTTDPLPEGRVGGPCEWPFDMGCCRDLDLEAVSDSLLTQCKTWVAEILWMATGRRFGLCEKLIRPCNRACGPTIWPRPNLVQGEWLNTCGCDNSSDCSCGPLCEICLDGPVHEVIDVLIDGEVVDPAVYRVDDHRFLVYTGEAGQCWPRCQAMDRDIDADNTFAIHYLRGTPVPEGGAFAAGQYLCEMLKMCLGDKSCRIPRNATQVSRAGVQITLAQGGPARPVTGIPEVDLWIGLVNPTQASSPARVWSPDLCGKSRTTTWPDVLRVRP